MLTYAAFNLDSTERAAILEFNQTNPEYMITVTDYGQSGNGDASGGMTRLLTEIGRSPFSWSRPPTFDRMSPPACRPAGRHKT